MTPPGNFGRPQEAQDSSNPPLDRLCSQRRQLVQLPALAARLALDVAPSCADQPLALESLQRPANGSQADLMARASSQQHLHGVAVRLAGVPHGQEYQELQHPGNLPELSSTS